MTYSQWNEAIVHRFFNERREGQKVFLQVDDVLLEAIGGPTGRADFIAAIRAGPENARRQGLSVCTQAKRTREDWRQNGAQGTPPYLAYLALFVLAASMEGEYDAEGYHKRLHRLIGEAPSNQHLPNYGEMWTLWQDLETWANGEQEGRMGVVSCDFAGAWPHVGLPRAQIVLTERERAKLPELFAEAELDSTAPPAAEDMAQLVCDCGQGLLEGRTLRRLGREGSIDEEMRSLTIEALLDELRSWDGEIVGEQGASGQFHTLRLNLRILSRATGAADSRIVAKDSPSLIDDEPLLVSGTAGRHYAMEEGQSGWRFLSDEDGKTADAAQIDWAQGLRLACGQAIFRLPRHQVRIFRKGEFDRIEGLIEVNRLDPHREFYVAVSEASIQSVDAWGRRAGTNWQRISLRNALPRGWSLFRADSADPTVRAPAEHPALRVDPQIRILLRGGLKIDGATRRYFDFAPPSICIEGLSQGATVSFNDSPLPVDAGDAVLPPSSLEFRASNRVVVRLGDGDERTASFNIASSADVSWNRVGQWGSQADGSAVEISASGAKAQGAVVFGFDPPTVLISPGRAAHVLGARPGQIFALPGEEIPSEWMPVWIVEDGRSNRRVIFCGGDPERCLPSSEPLGDRKRIRGWKNVLWNERMKLSGPTREPLVGLWRKFREIAEHA